MKNQLFTRNVLLGMLMTLVLAFSVQGNLADALSFGDTRTNDLQTILRGADFSVTFAVTLVDEARKSAYTAYTSEYTDTNGVVYVYEDKDSSGDYNSGDRRATKSSAFHYNNEAVRISVSGAGAKITSIGNNTITPASSITVKEGGSGAEALTAGDIVVNCSTSSYGEVTITASDATPSEDYPSGVRRAPNFVLTTYVTQYNQAVGTTRTIRLVGVTNGVAIGYDDQRDQPIYNGDSSHYPVTYTAAGGGMLRIQEGSREGAEAASLSTSSAAKVLLNMEGATNTVTAQLGGSFETSQGIYIFGNPQLSITSGNNQSGNPNAPLTNALQVTLQDNASAPAGVVGVPIKFDVTDKSPSGGILSQADESTGVTIVDASNEVVDSPSPGSTMYVRTGTDGVANIDFQLGTIPGEQTVTVSALNIARLTKTIKATATGTAATRQLFAEDIDRQGTTNIYTLVARVENGGTGDPDETVTFTTTKGFLTSGGTTAKTVTATTNAAGKARVTYNAGDSSGTLEVVASISVVAQNITTQLQEVTFNVRGGSSGGDDSAPSSPITRGSLNISVSGTGSTRNITVDAQNADGDGAHGISVLLNVTNGATLSRTSGGTPLTSTLTLPATAGDYVLTATTTADFTGDTETITVTLPGNLGLALIGDQVNGSQTIQVTARNAAGTLETTPVLVSLTGAGLSRTVTVTGSQNVPIVLPTASGTLTASATGYNEGSVTLPARSTTTTTTTTTTPTIPTGPAGGVPDSIVIDGSRTLDGTLAEASRLRVRVLDANDNGVSGVGVTFRVLSPGRGTFAGARGSGRAIRLDTDQNGYATVNFTPTTEGDVIVEAKAAKVTAGVTFILDVGESATTTTPDTTTPDTTTPDTTTPAPADVTLKVGAANRPVMYWITGGALYRQATGDATQITASAKDVVVDTAGGKLYWIEQTSERTGAIHSANLDGSNAKVVKTLTSAPMGLALDTANKKLYLTNGWGKIQRINVDGTRFETNFITGLTGPMDIAVSSGRVYWTDTGGSIHFVNLSDPKDIRTIASDLGALGGIAADAKNVYWTETTGQRSGRIRAANLNGSGVRDMYTITATVHGLAIDPATNRPYWTNGWGKVQRGLSNGKIQDVATGLSTPTALAIGGANDATDATPTKSSTPKTAANKYDVNGDGSVDSKDVDTLLLAVLAELTAAKYDVNGDGTVDVKDVRDVNKNLDNGAAGAPTLLGMKFSVLEVGRLQEQIDLLIATNDRSPAAMRTLVYLQQLIVMARPEQTQLLANYPNPFNPETWIPYALATDTDVRLTIYNAQGVVVRTLQLGQQSAGYYTDRERAAYWDGRNALGEQVASGIYFYQLETDDLSSLRKMVILK